MRQISKVFMLTMLATGAMYRAEAGDDVAGNAAASAAPVVAPTEAEVAATAAAKEAFHTQIKANFNNLVDVAETAFHFRKVKDPDTKIETKRATVVIPVPAPSVEGLVEIITAGGKGLDLLMEAARGVILEQAREYINDNEGVTEANFPYDNLAWEKIANLPKAERRGGGIAAELWADFAKDYTEIMPALTGKTKESVELAAKVFTTKFANAKTNKPVLKLLEQQLSIYMNNTTQAEQFTPVIEWLVNKLDTLIKTDETNLLLNL